VTKILAYCGFLQYPGLSLPVTGVDGAAVHTMKAAELRFLWSEVEWPFQPRSMQNNAVQFHQVITHMFNQGAVVPFRLLSMFDDQRALAALVTQHQSDFIADLERLRGFVQMECIVYLQGAKQVAESGPGDAHRHPRAAWMQSIEQYVESMKTALAKVGPEVRIRGIRSGARIFALVERGREQDFHACVESMAVPENFSRRTTGPRPASEFLSAPAISPRLAEAK
jgi:hypothetical protein